MLTAKRALNFLMDKGEYDNSNLLDVARFSPKYQGMGGLQAMNLAAKAEGGGQDGQTQQADNISTGPTVANSSPSMVDGVQDEQKLTPPPAMDSTADKSYVKAPIDPTKPPIKDTTNERLQDEPPVISGEQQEELPKEPGKRMATEQEIKDAEADAYRKTLFLYGALGASPPLIMGTGLAAGLIGGATGVAGGVLSGPSYVFNSDLNKMRTEPTQPDFSGMTPDEVSAWWIRNNGTTD